MIDDLAYNEPDAEEYGEGDDPQRLRLLDLLEAGNVADELTDGELAELGSRVVQDWERDDASRSKWKTTVEKAFARAAQEDPEDAKTYPWDGCANVDYPILTVSSQQFAARALPAIVKGDKIAGCRVLGLPSKTDRQAQQPPQPGSPEMPDKWAEKEARAKRVETYLNWLLFYKMEAWEDDTDILLSQLSIAGTVFKKVYYGQDGTCSDYVNPLRLTVAENTKTLKRCPRITHDYDLYPYEIEGKMRSGEFRQVDMKATADDDQAPRRLLEQHRLHDLDGDGFEEPWIITVDHETMEVLRIDPAFGAADVMMAGDDIVSITRWVPFVKYTFLRDPKGRFYEMGFGQLLEPLTDVVNATINQLLDAGTAENAGGGFIAAGLRIQGAGQGSTVRFKPGEYKVVNTPGGDVRNAIVERTLPHPSAVLFNLLELLLGAAKDISSVKDVNTGDAPSTAPVGTTLALIEQGLTVFTSIYKRIYRALKEEFDLVCECERRWNPNAQAEYSELLDDPAANFEADFSLAGIDVAPVSDPAVVTKMQAMARAQFLQQFLGTPFVDRGEVMKRILEAADIPNIDELIAKPSQPDPQQQADVAETVANTALKEAQTVKTMAEAGSTIGETEATNDFERGLGSVAGEPGHEMGAGGLQGAGGGPEGAMGGPDMGGGLPAGPASADGTENPF